MSGASRSLAEEVDLLFPLVDMPRADELMHHREGCPVCKDLAGDLEALRGRAIDGDAIRQLHQEMSHLSAKAWQWVLPYYLRYCLTPEAEYNSFETEFLVYGLSPLKEFEADTANRLALISSDQINVLRSFLMYLMTIEYWKSYCPTELQRGILFLEEILRERRGREAS
jgi:hypothetical protein